MMSTHNVSEIPRLTKRDLTRFSAKFYKDGKSGCWIWTSAADPHGYGRFSDINRASCKNSTEILQAECAYCTSVTIHDALILIICFPVHKKTICLIVLKRGGRLAIGD